MNRRELLKAFAVAAPLTVAGRVWAAPATDAAAARGVPARRLRRGQCRRAGRAAISTTPRARRLAIARPDAGNPNAALPLTADWGLHPALARQHLSAVGQAQIAFVPFAGTRRPDAAAISRRRTRSSWVSRRRLARLSFRLHEPACRPSSPRAKPIAFTDQLPLIFRGGAPDPEHRHQQRRQARRRRSPGASDQGHVCAKRSGLVGVGRFHGPRRRLSLDLARR